MCCVIFMVVKGLCLYIKYHPSHLISLFTHISDLPFFICYSFCKSSLHNPQYLVSLVNNELYRQQALPSLAHTELQTTCLAQPCSHRVIDNRSCPALLTQSYRQQALPSLAHTELKTTGLAQPCYNELYRQHVLPSLVHTVIQTTGIAQPCSYSYTDNRPCSALLMSYTDNRPCSALLMSYTDNRHCPALFTQLYRQQALPILVHTELYRHQALPILVHTVIQTTHLAHPC